MRVILHSDLNNFYASCECIDNPKLKKVPLVVIGCKRDRHGIVLAKNQVAKNAGVFTGQVLFEAEKLCPGLVCIEANFDKYMEISQKVRRIYMDYTDYIEPFGIDECWLDVTASQKLFGSGEQIANVIRERVKNELGLTVSIGVSFNKIFAKLGSDMKKPDATTVISYDNYKEIVWPLAVEDLLYVGKSTKNKLNRMNIFTIGQLATTSLNVLKSKLGKWGEYLYIFANGVDESPVEKLESTSIIKSIGNSMTHYKDMKTFEDVKVLIYLLVENIVSRCMRHGIYKIKTVHLFIRDSNLYSFSLQTQLASPSLLTEEISKTALDLFQKNYNWQSPVRGLGVNVSGFVNKEGEQLSAVRNEIKYQKEVKIETAVRDIRKKYGNVSIIRAIVLKDKRLAKKDIMHDNIIHPVSFFKAL